LMAPGAPWGGCRAAFPLRGRLGPERPNRESPPRNSKWGNREINSMRGPTALKFCAVLQVNA
jgi:hypothetical protein